MKTFFKNNLIWIFALVLSIGTMSFKLSEKKNVAAQWYPVATNGSTITSSTPLAGQPNDPDCRMVNASTICAILFEPNASLPFPTTVSDAETNHGATLKTRRASNP